MKKLVAVFLALVTVFSFLTPAAAASMPGKPPENTQAAIIVPGVIETMLMTDPTGGKENRFYAPLLHLDASVIRDFSVGAFKALFFYDYDTLTDAALKITDAAIGNFSMEPDGTSTYELYTPVSGAEESSYAAMTESGKWADVWYGAQIAPALAEKIGGGNVFVFTYDWRLGSPTITERFAAFLAEVKATVGCDKVNVYCDSYGCQVVSSYLYTHGYEDIARIVFDSPAWTGTRLFKCLMADNEEDLYFHLADGAEVLLDFLTIETDLRPLLNLLPDRIVQHVACEIIKHAMDSILRTAPGLWCCCSINDYEGMKAKMLDPVENAAVIAEVDKAQYGVMRHVPEILAAAEEAGIKMAVIMNEGAPLMAGDKINSDGVIDAAGGSGGTCLPLGETFTDGRNGPHVSPANDYDLTDAFLPDRTWVFYGQLHGQSAWEDEASELVTQLMLTDGPETVFSDPRFPQFSDSHCPSYDVSLRLTDRGGCVLRPGETKTVTLTPKDGAYESAFGKIEISYIEFEYLPLTKTRTQYFRTAAN